tara:strand:- start:1043 stop:1153 length:111 start_codon:yes stop_codon:yes gene_type:complete
MDLCTEKKLKETGGGLPEEIIESKKMLQILDKPKAE